MDPTQPPRVFSERYELNHLIARGGMAEVYRAHDRLLDRPVAVKVLFPELSVDRSFVERFRREAQAAANLSNPNIVPVFDWGEDSGTYFIVMEFIDGRPLSAILKSAGPLSAERTADIGTHVAAALGYAHKHGVIHRDVKPGNVLITDDGLVKVTDFGIARAINTEESLTQTGAVMGTATYFSPEQAEGMGVDSRSDIYSLGVVLYEMVTGRAPFLGDTPVAVASKHVRDHPPAPREINPSVPASFEAIILKAMAKNPDHRYATAEELRADLLRFNEGRTVLASSDATVAVAAVGAAGTTAVIGATANATQVVPANGGEFVPEEEEAQPNRTRTYVIVLVVLLVALALVGFLLARQLGYLGGSASFSMPGVVGQPVATATATLDSDGLKVTTQSQVSTEAVGTVLRTDPAKGVLVKKGDSVTLDVAAAPSVTTIPVTNVAVPSVVNTTQANAEQLLTAAGLKWVISPVTNNATAGTVIASSPQPGTQTKSGSTVTLTVSNGPGSVSVPNVAGELPSTASANIEAAGLTFGSQTSQPSSTIGGGYVIGTSPASGTKVGAGTTVNIIVSTGSATVVVQNVVGQTTASATTTLQGQGLMVSISTLSSTSSLCGSGSNQTPFGSVEDQSPEGGRTAPSGSTVNLTVCPQSTVSTTTTSTSTTSP